MNGRAVVLFSPSWLMGIEISIVQRGAFSSSMYSWKDGGWGVCCSVMCGNKRSEKCLKLKKEKERAAPTLDADNGGVFARDWKPFGRGTAQVSPVDVWAIAGLLMIVIPVPGRTCCCGACAKTPGTAAPAIAAAAERSSPWCAVFFFIDGVIPFMASNQTYADPRRLERHTYSLLFPHIYLSIYISMYLYI